MLLPEPEYRSRVEFVITSYSIHYTKLYEPEIAYRVGFGGRTENWHDEHGCYRVRWLPHRVVKGVAYDTPVAGYRSGMTDQLRLWKSEAVESFDFQAFNVGDYYQA